MVRGSVDGYPICGLLVHGNRSIDWHEILAWQISWKESMKSLRRPSFTTAPPLAKSTCPIIPTATFSSCRTWLGQFFGGISTFSNFFLRFVKGLWPSIVTWDVYLWSLRWRKLRVAWVSPAHRNLPLSSWFPLHWQSALQTVCIMPGDMPWHETFACTTIGRCVWWDICKPLSCNDSTWCHSSSPITVAFTSSIRLWMELLKTRSMMSWCKSSTIVLWAVYWPQFSSLSCTWAQNKAWWTIPSRGQKKRCNLRWTREMARHGDF